MAVAGAIFDCDGTILDSMPMWTKTCVDLLERYGVADAAAVFAAHESLDMDKKCYWYHENLGIGESGEALYRELWQMVEEAYRTTVRPYPGVRGLLDELRVARVPMVVASSTPTELLRMALEAHGLAGYFEELIFAGDVGRGKEYPDVYLAACERLGTPREDTWVFEDAPFGIRSAARAGFPVVGVLNDHDGRDEAFVARWSTLVARGYDGLTCGRLEALRPRTLNVLAVGGSPEQSAPALAARLAEQADWVVAVDKGAEALMACGVVPDALCGDEDSACAEALAWVRASGAERVTYHPEKDDTDLGLALCRAREEAERRGAALRLTLTCVSGGRPDHALGVWGVLARNADVRPQVVEDGFEAWVLSREGCGHVTVGGREGMQASVVALAPHTVVSETGMRWNLDHAELELLGDLGISNRPLAPDAAVTCHQGVAAVFLRA